MNRAGLLLCVALAMSGCGADARRLNQRGNEAFVQQEYALAQEIYAAATAADAELAAPLYNRANVYYRQGAYAEAQQALQSAMLKSAPDLIQLEQFNLGNALFQSSDYAGAVAAYQEALRLNPQDEDAKHNLELALQAMQTETQQPQESPPQTESQPPNEPRGGQGETDPAEQQPAEDASADSSEQTADEPTQESQPDAPPTAPPAQPVETPPQETQPQDASAQSADESPPARPGQVAVAQPVGLTEDQARQLLAAASQDTETLQEYLQQSYVFPYVEVDEDW